MAADAENLIRKTEKYDQFYDVEHELGRGRFAVVKKCVCKNSGKAYAAKIIKKSRTNSHGRSGREQLLLEIDILNKSTHPKMVRLFDVFETRTEMQLILEFAEGGDLHRHCIEADVMRTEKEICYLMRQICEAVRYLHDQKIVHLDLKPDNILLAKKSEVFPEIRLIDFGLSRRLDGPYSQFDIVGTPEYVAPEVLAFEPIHFGSDMWSIGVVTYVLLSGISPFAGDDVMETYANIGMVDYDFDCEEFDEISDGATDFIEKLLLRQPKDRLIAREALEHEWLKQLEGGLKAEDIVEAQHASQIRPPDAFVEPLVDEDYPSSSESETHLEKSHEFSNDDSAFTGTSKTIKEPEPIQEPEPEPIKEPEPEPITEPEPEPITGPDSGPVKGLEPETVKDPEPEPVKESDSEPITEPEPKPLQEPEPEPEPETVKDFKSVSEKLNISKLETNSLPKLSKEPEKSEPEVPREVEQIVSTTNEESQPVNNIKTKQAKGPPPKVAPKTVKKSAPLADKPEKIQLEKDKNDNVSIKLTDKKTDDNSKFSNDKEMEKKGKVSEKLTTKDRFNSGTAKDKISRFERVPSSGKSSPCTNPERAESPSKFRTKQTSLRSDSTSKLASKFERSENENLCEPSRVTSPGLRSDSTSKLTSKFERSESNHAKEKMDSHGLRSDSTSKLTSKFERSENDTPKVTSPSLRSESTSKLASKFERSEIDHSNDTSRSSSPGLRSDLTSKLGSKFDRSESDHSNQSSRSSSPTKISNKYQRSESGHSTTSSTDSPSCSRKSTPTSSTSKLTDSKPSKTDSPARQPSRNAKVSSTCSIAEKMAKFSHGGSDSPTTGRQSPRHPIKIEKKTHSATFEKAEKKEIGAKLKVNELSRDSPRSPHSTRTDTTKPNKSSPDNQNSSDKSNTVEDTHNMKRVRSTDSGRSSPLSTSPACNSPSQMKRISTEKSKTKRQYSDEEKTPSTPTATLKKGTGITLSMNIGGSVSASGKKLHVGPLVSANSVKKDETPKKVKQQQQQQNDDGNDEEENSPKPKDDIKTETKNGLVKVKLGVGRPNWKKQNENNDQSTIYLRSKSSPTAKDDNGDESSDGDDEFENNQNPRSKELRTKSRSFSRRARASTVDSGSPNSHRKSYRRLYVTKVRNSKVFDADFSLDSEAAKIMQRVDKDVLQVELRLKSTDLKLLP